MDTKLSIMPRVGFKPTLEMKSLTTAFRPEELSVSPPDMEVTAGSNVEMLAISAMPPIIRQVRTSHGLVSRAKKKILNPLVSKHYRGFM